MAEAPNAPRTRRSTPIFREEMLAFIREELERARHLARQSSAAPPVNDPSPDGDGEVDVDVEDDAPAVTVSTDDDSDDVEVEVDVE